MATKQCSVAMRVFLQDELAIVPGYALLNTENLPGYTYIAWKWN